MSKPKYCEDCGDECETRRTRCPHCGKLVCGWCYYHVHGVMSVVASESVGIEACQQRVQLTDGGLPASDKESAPATIRN